MRPVSVGTHRVAAHLVPASVVNVLLVSPAGQVSREGRVLLPGPLGRRGASPAFSLCLLVGQSLRGSNHDLPLL